MAKPAVKDADGGANTRKPANLNEHKGTNDLPSAKELLKYYEDMLRIRRFEEKAGQLYGMGLIGGFCHLYIGQEAIAVGMQSVMGDKDSVITAYRDHGHLLAAGMPGREVMAELTGRSAGCSQGKGGSMHMFDTKNRFYGGHGIVGAQIPLGTGLAFANRYRGDGGFAVAYMGDGAANQGQVYESFNMAALWKLPVIYVIENNEYAMGTSVKRGSALPDFYRRGEPWGIPGHQVDGMDVLAVRRAALEAAEYVRSGNGPILLEMKTYRYRGHSMSDPAKYRTKEELQEMKDKHDPIEGLKTVLFTHGYASEESLKELEKKIKEEVNDAAEFAKSAPEPEASALMTQVYVGE